MLVYIALIIIPFIFSFIRKGKTNYFEFGNFYDDKKGNYCIASYFLILLFLLSFRGLNVGTDTKNYFAMYNDYNSQNAASFFVVKPEFLFPLLNILSYKIFPDFRFFILITSVFIIVPIYLLYKKNKGCSFLEIVLFSNMVTFIMLFSGIRQCIAMSICIISYKYVKERKLIPFLLLCLLAIFFHHSGFMVFFLYPVYHMKIKRKFLLFIIPLWLIVFLFNGPIFNALASAASIFSDRYEVTASSTGAFGSLFLFMIFSVFSFVITDEKLMDEEDYGLRNILLLTVFLQSFAPLNQLAMRLNEYFILFIPIAISRFVEIPRKGYANLANVSKVVLTVFFTFYFVYTTYNQYRTGLSTLHTVPYSFWWD